MSKRNGCETCGGARCALRPKKPKEPQFVPVVETIEERFEYEAREAVAAAKLLADATDE